MTQVVQQLWTYGKQEKSSKKWLERDLWILLKLNFLNLPLVIEMQLITTARLTGSNIEGQQVIQFREKW